MSNSDQWGEFAREMYTGSEVRGGWRSRGLQSESPRDGSGGQVRGWGLVDKLAGEWGLPVVRARVCASSRWLLKNRIRIRLLNE